METILDSIAAVEAALERRAFVVEETGEQDSADALLDSIRLVSAALPPPPETSETASDPGRLVETVLKMSHEVLRALPLPDVELGDVDLAILPLIGRRFDENLHSDFLAGLLEPAVVGNLAQAVFARLFRAGRPEGAPSHDEIGHLVVRRERRLDRLDGRLAGCKRGARRLDVVARGRSHVLVIENKVWTGESVDQTKDYAEVVTRAYPEHQPCLLLLSPHGRHGADRRFRGLSYARLHSILVECRPDAGSHPHARTLLDTYIREVAAAFLYEEFTAFAKVRRLLEERGYHA